MEKYEAVRDIGSGNFGVARLMRNRETRELVAVKCIGRGHRIDENVYREIINHRSLRHPNIIRFKEVILTPTHLMIVMEYAAGGELFDRICDRGRFSEDEARYFFQQLICGVSYCHHLQICHRDLKMENVLLDGSAAPRLKICDFGYSKSSVLHSRPKSAVGTPAYIAPEVLSRREYDGKLADVWSCGVTLYVMLVGAYPFEDQDDPKNIRKTIQRIMSVQYRIPDHVHISEECRQLIARIFVNNPMRRITMKEIKSHPWFLKNLPRELTETAQAMYYRRDSTVPSFSDQTSEEIMKIVQEARTVPKSSRSGYGWSDEGSDDEEEKEEEDRPEENEEEEDALNPTSLNLCTKSPDPASCHTIVADAVLASPHAHTSRPAEVLRAIIARSLDQHDAAAAAVGGMHRRASHPRQRAVLADCVELMGLARDRLADAAGAAVAAPDDARTWLSAVLTDHVTCLDGLEDGPLRDAVGAHLEPLKSLASASLAVLNAVGSSTGPDGARDVLAEVMDKFPSWVPARDRTLLVAAGAVQADVVVAKDGSGKYKTVKEAVDAAPDGGKSRYVIYVKKGLYKENLEVGKKKRELMIVGDGMDATVITGSRNVVDGATTFNSATLVRPGHVSTLPWL